jgi:chemotaxis protein MotB
MSAARGRGRSRGDKHEEEHVNHERWMVTYADMLTLLLVLFIVLYAISSLNTDKFAQLKASLSNAFGNGQSPVLNGGTGPVDGSSLTQQAQSLSANSINKMPTSQLKVVSTADQTAVQKEIDEFNKIKAAIKASLHQRHLDGTAAFSIDQRGLVVTLLTDELVFAGNSAVLEPQGGVILSAVVPALLRIDNQIQVDGHTNQQNVSTAPYPSGWELSSARASAVVRFLISSGHVSAGRLSAVGFSDQRPLLPASDPRSVTRNRRVDIVVLSKLPASARDALVSLGSTAVNSSGG